MIRQSLDFGEKTEPQDEQQERGQDGDVQAVDHQHVVSACAAKVIGPKALHAAGFADERGFHHACGIQVPRVEAFHAAQRAGANSEHSGQKTRSAAARFYTHGAGAGSGGRPKNVAARRQAFIVELPRILEIADTTYPGFQCDKLSVAQIGGDLGTPKSNGDAGTGFRPKFDDELIAPLGKCRGSNHAPVQHDALVSARVDFGRPARPMEHFEKCAGE